MPRDGILKDVAIIEYGKSPNLHRVDDGPVPIYGTSGLQGYASTALFPDEIIVVGRKGTLDQPIYVRGPSWVIDTAFAVLPKRGVDAKWLYYYLVASNLQSLNEVTGVPSINRDYLYKLPIFIPDDDGQKQVGNVLWQLDAAILQVEAVLENERRIKVGMMQDLLTRGIDERGGIRSEETDDFWDSPLGRFPTSWDVSPAHTLCHAVIDCKNRTPPVEQDGHPVIRTPNVRSGTFVYENLAYTDADSYLLWTARGQPEAGDVVITREAPFGEACQIPDDIPKPCLGQRMMLYKANEERLNAAFLVFMIHSDRLQKHLFELAGGSTVGHIRVGDIRTLLIPHPRDTAEQERIAGALAGVNKSLASHERRRRKLMLLKAGLMRDLLSGKVRVPALQEERPQAAEVAA